MDLNQESKIMFFGTTYTMQDFADKFAKGELEKGMRLAGILVKKGEAVVAEIKTPLQETFEKVAQEELISQAVDMLDMEAEMAKDLKANKNREGKLTYPGVDVIFGTYQEAMKLYVYCQNTLRIKDLTINTDIQGHRVIAKNITEAELNAINRYYMGMKVTTGIQAGMQKSVDTITNGVDYAAQNVIAPAAQIGIKGVANIFKSIAKVGAKVSSTAITATTQTIKSAKEELIQDPDVIRAANELIQTKDTFKRKALGVGKATSGIRMLSE